MTFTLQINCDKMKIIPHADREVAAILRRLSREIAEVPVVQKAQLDNGMILMDINGNRVGVARFVEG